ncbi:hypothetical protein [Paratractidigestivibacter sp.]|uniref:hypothetical protein n=1 Tax=Paratractidigestivibacter sp. TaxID=2847316 RepID=UPI002AC95509|nr:hypothetical protein [Paratractidigestivibacter sp.]
MADMLSFANVGSTGNSGNSFWNYSKPDKDGYCLSIEGTVVEIAEVAAKKFGTDEIDRWPQGNAKLNVMITLAKDDGTEVSWEFKPRTKKDKHSNPMGMTIALSALFEACTNAGMPGQHLNELLGKYVAINTRERRDSEGNPIGYDVRCPRPFAATIIRDGDMTKVRGTVKYKEEAAPAATEAAPAAAPVYPAPQAQPQQYVVQQPQQYTMPVPQQPAVQPAYYDDTNW